MTSIFLYFSWLFRNSNILTTNYNHIHLLPPTAPVFPTCSLPIVMPFPSKDLFSLFLSMCRYLCLHEEYTCTYTCIHIPPGTSGGSQRHEIPWSWSYHHVVSNGTWHKCCELNFNTSEGQWVPLTAEPFLQTILFYNPIRNQSVLHVGPFNRALDTHQY